MSGCPSVRMEKFGSHWTGFHEIWYFSILAKSVEKKSFLYNLRRITDTQREDKYTFLFISHSIFLQNEKCFRQTCFEIQNTHVVFPNLSSKIVPCIRMWKHTVEPDRSYEIKKAQHAGYLRLKSHTQNMQYLLLFLYNNG